MRLVKPRMILQRSKREKGQRGLAKVSIVQQSCAALTEAARVERWSDSRNNA